MKCSDHAKIGNNEYARPARPKFGHDLGRASEQLTRKEQLKTMPELSQHTTTTLNPAIIEAALFTQAFEAAEHQALGRCEWESRESYRGACDGGFQCCHTATVYDLADENEYCLAHFQERAADRAYYRPPAPLKCKLGNEE